MKYRIVEVNYLYPDGWIFVSNKLGRGQAYWHAAHLNRVSNLHYYVIQV